MNTLSKMSIMLLATAFFVSLLAGFSSAVMDGEATLLAVSWSDDLEFYPTKAEVQLEITPGTGRVFIETIPFSRIDTQMSIRFAREMACKYLDYEELCRMYDFAYTINSQSSFIGGPSGGALITGLTVSTLKGWEFNRSVSVTGSINSGELIGNVGGLKDKIRAAKIADIERVLIPEGSRFIEEDNQTTDLYLFGEEIGITVVEVSTLNQVMDQLTGNSKKESTKDIAISKSYLKTMKEIRDNLCTRGQELRGNLTLTNETENSHEIDALLYLQRAEENMDTERYYSVASYCFGSNIELRYLVLDELNLSVSDYETIIERLESEIMEFEQSFDKKTMETITDLQTKIIVKERLKDAGDHLIKARLDIKNNVSDDVLWKIAYSWERIYSAKVWSKFFGTKGKHFELDKESLKQSCIVKIGEAQERINFVETLVPIGLEEIDDELENAKSDLEKRDYELCLFTASKAKAEADVIISASGESPKTFNKTLANKRKVVEKLIADVQEEAIFPIVGYSYLEYSKSLEKDDIYLSNLYLTYALEMSDISIYFESGQGLKINEYLFYLMSDIGIRDIYFLGLGLLIGALSISAIVRLKKRKVTQKRHGLLKVRD